MPGPILSLRVSRTKVCQIPAAYGRGKMMTETASYVCRTYVIVTKPGRAAPFAACERTTFIARDATATGPGRATERRSERVNGVATGCRKRRRTSRLVRGRREAGRRASRRATHGGRGIPERTEGSSCRGEGNSKAQGRRSGIARDSESREGEGAAAGEVTGVRCERAPSRGPRRWAC